MPPLPGLNPQRFAKIGLIATDMDGTLTRWGKFRPKLLDVLYRLQVVKIPVLIVTGRSAGWASAIAHYLPVVGAIAENGGVFCPIDPARDTVEPELLLPIADLAQHRQQLAACFAQLQTAYPHLREAADNRYRLTDWTFDVAGFTPTEIADLGDRCGAAGWGFTYSTVQCHIKLPAQEKSAGLLHVLARHFPAIAREQVITIGDSPNDESLFQADLFELSVGVANLRHYLPQLQHHPRYLTHSAEAEGFCELAEAILCHHP